MIRLLIAFVTSLAFAAAPVLAGDHEVGPKIPKATGEPHPEGNLFWRINHPRLLGHDRNLTVREGNRQVQASLKACMTCHAVKGDDGQPVSFEDPRHFCRVCHDFVAVRPDCFECHKSTPDDTASQALLKPEIPDDSEIAAYLKEASE